MMATQGTESSAGYVAAANQSAEVNMDNIIPNNGTSASPKQKLIIIGIIAVIIIIIVAVVASIIEFERPIDSDSDLDWEWDSDTLDIYHSGDTNYACGSRYHVLQITIVYKAKHKIQ